MSRRDTAQSPARNTPASEPTQPKEDPTMTHALTRPCRLAAGLAAALALLALAAPAPATPRPVPDRSYLAEGPGGLRLALVVHHGRLEAYACDGTSRKAFFTARARTGRLTLRNRHGDKLSVRLAARSARATLTLDGVAPLALTARKARVAIFTATIRPDGAVFGTAPGGGVLGAHLSQLGLVGALARPGRDPRAFVEPAFSRVPLFVDGRALAYPPDRAAEALAGEWRWIVAPGRIVGATTKVLDLGDDAAIPAQLLTVSNTKFIELEADL